MTVWCVIQFTDSDDKCFDRYADLRKIFKDRAQAYKWVKLHPHDEYCVEEWEVE